MNDIAISCNYCHTPVKLKIDKIYMNCHCCDDRRIIDIKEFIIENKHDDYLYSIVNDEHIYSK